MKKYKVEKLCIVKIAHINGFKKEEEKRDETFYVALKNFKRPLRRYYVLLSKNHQKIYTNDLDAIAYGDGSYVYFERDLQNSSNIKELDMNQILDVENKLNSEKELYNDEERE